MVDGATPRELVNVDRPALFLLVSRVINTT